MPPRRGGTSVGRFARPGPPKRSSFYRTNNNNTASASSENSTSKSTPFIPKKRLLGNAADAADDEAAAAGQLKWEQVQQRDNMDVQQGFTRYAEGPPLLGWMVNMHSTLVKDSSWPGGRSAVDYYFIKEDGDGFKATVQMSPYFFVLCRDGTESDVEEYLRRRFESTIERMNRVQKEDLDMPNHLTGKKRTLLQLHFRNTSDLMTVRRVLLPAAEKNKSMRKEGFDASMEAMNNSSSMQNALDDELPMDFTEKSSVTAKAGGQGLANILDLREFDIPYHLRVSIDRDYRVGHWYTVRAVGNQITMERRNDKAVRADPVVLAFDIETTKLPLKFPDASIDSIMMISYMIDGQGYLITNREIVSEDIDDFEYTPKPEYEGPFTVFNEPDEKALIIRFFEHIQQAKPTVIVTYNGDFFDWPFVEARAMHHELNMFEWIGFAKDNAGEYKSTFAIHMDALRWVKRDSYLPVGSQGLKAVTTVKLGYNPMELDPEDMTRFASEKPQVLASYSVSDAVATFYLYMKYVHPFIFSLCNIIPLNPDEVLRKGSGTLCETLLMVESFHAQVLMPNKQETEHFKMHQGHLLENESYVGGHVEALAAGVYRSDLETKFQLVPEAFEKLSAQVEKAVQFYLEVEAKIPLNDVVNYEEVVEQIQMQLLALRDTPTRQDKPLIYHLDVAAMYPNVILTNRLQPPAMVTESTCASCDYNQPGAQCQRRMTWDWRGEYFPAKLNEYRMLKRQLESERFPAKFPSQPTRPFHALTKSEQAIEIKKRLTQYCKRIYKRTHVTEVVQRESIVCQRENSFYVDTVRRFRDRRYEYKTLHKEWKRRLDQAASQPDPVLAAEEAKKLIIVYDSLQLAHKCILNSFYGYVMRRGARWYSLDMAAIVCHTGAQIIKMAREWVEQIGRPLELDTDGIWCILPESFPETFQLQLTNGKKVTLSYPCVMLNHLVHDQFTNHQYQELHIDERGRRHYSMRSENSIFFEIDGPYRAMVLPASTEEDKLLKKRYAVFDHDGSLAELKGFEVKRRGELRLIKLFQSQIFSSFLVGHTLSECYAASAVVADRWLDILYSKGSSLSDHELLDLISENRSMSKSLEDYGDQKSTSISTAKRLSEFLGDQMVRDKGLACQFVIVSKPLGAPVAERAIPIAIFSAEGAVQRHYLRHWLKDPALTDFNIRTLLDWPYYLERLGAVIQKLITIPAAMQQVSNPVPRVPYPDWLSRRLESEKRKGDQKDIRKMFLERGMKTNEVEIKKINENNEIDQTTHSNHNSNNSIVDMEDLSIPIQEHSQVVIQEIPRKNKKNKKLLAKQEQQRQALLDQQILAQPMPDLLQDYQGFIRYQKRKWKQQRLERAQRRRLGLSGILPLTSNIATPTLATAGSMEQWVHQQTMHRQIYLHVHPWQVIQIIPHGSFTKLYVLIQDKLMTLQLRVPRVFYVNCLEQLTNDLLACDEKISIQRVSMTLPRPCPVGSVLYRVEMEESVYQRHGMTWYRLASHPSVEGVYERQVDGVLRALLQLGCVCRYTATNESPTSILDAALCQSLSSSQYPYLEAASLSHLTRVYIYYVAQQNLIVWYKQGDNQVHLLAQKSVPLEGMKTLLKRMIKEHNDNENSGAENESNEKSFNKALTLIDNVLITNCTSFQDGIQKFVQSMKSIPNVICLLQEKEEKCSPLLISHFPVLDIPCHPLVHANGVGIDWQRQVCQHFIETIPVLDDWLDQQLTLARYGHCPVGNTTFARMSGIPWIMSLFYARRLQEGGCVLWWNERGDGGADLGGREEDDHVTSHETLSNPNAALNLYWNKFSVECELSHLSMNALVIGLQQQEQGQLLDDLLLKQKRPEQTPASAQTIYFHSTHTHTMNTHSLSALTHLSQMLLDMARDCLVSRNLLADQCLTLFEAWLKRNPLMDPWLCEWIEWKKKFIMKQLISYLQQEWNIQLKWLNEQENRVLLLTTKQHLASFEAFWQHLMQSLSGNTAGSHSPFVWITWKVLNIWKCYLGLDEWNFSGWRVKSVNDKLTHENETDLSIEEQDEMEQNNPSFECFVHSDTVQVLPAIMQESFHWLFLEWMELLKDKEISQQNPHFEKDENENDESVSVMEPFIPKVLSLLRSWQKKRTFSPELFEWDLSRGYCNVETGSDRDPLLVFISTLCSWWGLIPLEKRSTRSLFQASIALLSGASLFSPLVKYKPLFSPSLYVYHLHCDYCSLMTDHLCVTQFPFAPCSGCGQDWSSNWIEMKLLAQLTFDKKKRITTREQICSACHKPRAGLLHAGEKCSCGAKYREEETGEEWQSILRTVANVAERIEAKLLKGWVEQELAL